LSLDECIALLPIAEQEVVFVFIQEFAQHRVLERRRRCLPQLRPRRLVMPICAEEGVQFVVNCKA
jgi:hypothetical protein